MQCISEDWNFKGFGITLLKSAVFRDAFGFAVRLPLTQNFASWERRPALPSISSSIAVFLPQLCLCLFLNISLRIEYLQSAFFYIAHVVPSICTAILLVLLRGLALAISALLYPLTRTPLLLATVAPGDKKRNIKGSLGLMGMIPINCEALRRWKHSEERIDVSCSWRWSFERGYEFRIAYSHWYAVPVASLIEAVMPKKILPTSVLDTRSGITLISKLMDWIPEHAAAIGLSFTGPVHNDKNGLLVTASALLSLSSFYLTKPLLTPSTTLGHSSTAIMKSNRRRVSLEQHLISDQEPQHPKIGDRDDQVSTRQTQIESLSSIATKQNIGISRSANARVASI
jgi:hypothetical protein